MGKFNFDYYNETVKKIKCFYTFDGKINKDFFWEGYIVTKNIDGILDIEGYEKDSMDSLPHFRYIFGNKAISSADKSLIFVIYPSKIAPILYNMRYNEEDGCFYGTWMFVNNSKHVCPHNRSGDAIIRIEDVQIDTKEINNHIKKIAKDRKKEYSTDIEIFSSLLESQMLVDDNYCKLFENKRLQILAENIKQNHELSKSKKLAIMSENIKQK